MTMTPDARRNRLLAALPDPDWQGLLARIERVELVAGQVLQDAGLALPHVYFLTTAIVSLSHVMRSGASAEVAVVGQEGLIGFSLFMGGDTTPGQAVVQRAGQAFRLPAQALKQEFNRGGALTAVLLRYAQSLITQVSQTSVCNSHHTLEQRLCRWLLLTLDRQDDLVVRMTQEMIANALGVRREGVTEVALRLQRAGLMRYARGRIEVLDRAGLEARACECHEVVRLAGPPR